MMMLRYYGPVAGMQQHRSMPGCLHAGRQGSTGKVVWPCLPLQLRGQACSNKVGAFIS